MQRALLVFGLFAFSDAAALNKQPVMKLRGGLAGVDANQVATVVAGRSAASSAPELQRILLLAETNASDADATNGSVLL